MSPGPPKRERQEPPPPRPYLLDERMALKPTPLDRIEAMLAELLRRQTPPEGLAGLWAAFPWLRPAMPPAEPHAAAAWHASLLRPGDEGL